MKTVVESGEEIVNAYNEAQSRGVILPPISHCICPYWVREFKGLHGALYAVYNLDKIVSDWYWDKDIVFKICTRENKYYFNRL